jgi:ubiquinone/menaquinone biosynthesis C-methylase UbiE
MNENFYKIFEDRFRGTRETIKSRLATYLPFINPLKGIYDICNTIDLGCGRGEWLELTTEIGMIAHGVDLDDGMLSACRERGLSVETGNAISLLKSLPDQSQVVVSGFHIVEHIPFTDLQTLIQEAFRVLKPAGLLILETPNPENIVVSSTNFYLDPTHLRPLPPLLLSFLTEHYGFYRNKILRLQEPFNPKIGMNPSLFHVLYGVSPDYSVIAQKPAKDSQLAIFDSTFNKEYGFSLETLVIHFDSQLSQLENIQAELSDIRTQLKNIYLSRSWRITAPLRKFGDIGRRFLYNIRRLFPLRTLPRRLMHKTLRMFSLRVIIPLSENRTAYKVVNYFPTIKRYLQRLVKRSIYDHQLAMPHLPVNEHNTPISPPAMRIYVDLLNEIENRKQQK